MSDCVSICLFNHFLVVINEKEIFTKKTKRVGSVSGRNNDWKFILTFV